ncbi:serine protease [Chamaesiphon sp. VAR_48_metabat_135_sub]|uniref:S1 family peptidase n=1 Tax=Chamaesiphon sp. VAR_48_metabat_135_sub TaxID=2964699 RepID=UPI00286A2EA7|nr:serine protease [Chamaesiphon sp. VAR_48_metabat_135_sub]
MRTHHHLAAMLTGTAVVSALVITLPNAAQALPGTKINDIAREVTVLIRGDQSHGSGVIIKKSGNTYYVLTAEHVVREKDDYKLVTADQKAYPLEYSKVKPIDGVDLAIVKFTSDKNYPVAKIGTAKTTEGQDVFVSGWPSNGAVGKEAGGELIRQFTSGQISGFLKKPLRGYSMSYTNVTRAGMSGCPVLDTAGRVVAIHGMGDKEDTRNLEGAEKNFAGKIKSGFNYAVPISVFLQKADSINFDSDSLEIDKSAAPEPGAAYVASGATDPRDKINNIQETLKSVSDITKTINTTTDTIKGFQDSLKGFGGLFGR